MIQSKADYLHYLEADRKALCREKRYPLWFMLDPIWSFQILLRKTEYYTNCKKSFISKIILYCLRLRLKRMSILLGFSIPINTIGPGLFITHYGTIIIHNNARIGTNLRINADVVIGEKNGGTNVPTIGDDVVIEPGTKIFGKISIANGIHIGANSVVNKSFNEPGIVIAGVPARKIKYNPYYKRYI